MSVRDIADCFDQEEIEVNYSNVYRWIEKYSIMVSTYLNGIVPRVGDWFRADEVWIKVAGKQNKTQLAIFECAKHIPFHLYRQAI